MVKVSLGSLMSTDVTDLVSSDLEMETGDTVDTERPSFRRQR